MRVSRQPTLQRRATNANAHITASGIPDSMAYQPPVFQLFASDQSGGLEEEEMDQEVVQQKAEAEPAFDAPPEENNGGGDENGANDDGNDAGDSGAGGDAGNGSELDGQTGMPMQLKAGIESMSGMDMSDVKVHYNSDKPIQMQALAYAQGTDIHIGPGQEQHLPHEAWHVVQQKQGRVQATTQLKEDGSQGVPLNDDAGLEQEADVMGAKALEAGRNAKTGGAPLQRKAIHLPAVQRIATGKYVPKKPVQEENMDGSMAGSPELLNQKGADEEIKGSVPKTKPEGWSHVEQVLGSPKGKYVRFHLINHNIGGKGENWNLVPTTVALNLGNKWRSFEEEVKSEFENESWIHMKADVDYWTKDEAGADGFPKQIQAIAFYQKPNLTWGKIADCKLKVGLPDLNDDSQFKIFDEMGNDGYWLRALPKKKYGGWVAKQKRYDAFAKASAKCLHQATNKLLKNDEKVDFDRMKLLDRWQDWSLSYSNAASNEELIEFKKVVEPALRALLSGENENLSVVFPDENYQYPAYDENGNIIQEIFNYDQLLKLETREPTDKELEFFAKEQKQRDNQFGFPPAIGQKRSNLDIYKEQKEISKYSAKPQNGFGMNDNNNNFSMSNDFMGDLNNNNNNVSTGIPQFPMGNINGININGMGGMNGMGMGMNGMGMMGMGMMGPGIIGNGAMGIMGGPPPPIPKIPIIDNKLNAPNKMDNNGNDSNNLISNSDKVSKEPMAMDDTNENSIQNQSNTFNSFVPIIPPINSNNGNNNGIADTFINDQSIMDDPFMDSINSNTNMISSFGMNNKNNANIVNSSKSMEEIEAENLTYQIRECIQTEREWLDKINMQEQIVSKLDDIHHKIEVEKEILRSTLLVTLMTSQQSNSNDNNSNNNNGSNNNDQTLFQKNVDTVGVNNYEKMLAEEQNINSRLSQAYGNLLKGKMLLMDLESELKKVRNKRQGLQIQLYNLEQKMESMKKGNNNGFQGFGNNNKKFGDDNNGDNNGFGQFSNII